MIIVFSNIITGAAYCSPGLVLFAAFAVVSVSVAGGAFLTGSAASAVAAAGMSAGFPVTDELYHNQSHDRKQDSTHQQAAPVLLNKSCHDEPFPYCQSVFFVRARFLSAGLNSR